MQLLVVGDGFEPFQRIIDPPVVNLTADTHAVGSGVAAKFQRALFRARFFQFRLQFFKVVVGLAGGNGPRPPR